VLAQQITIRKASSEDATDIANLFKLAYAECSHPCKGADFVRDEVLSRKAAWRVAVAHNHIVACMSISPSAWNRSWELGRAVTHPDYRRAGIGTELVQESIDEACGSPSCDVVISFPRCRTALDVLTEAIKPPMISIGHDGAINVANGTREYHAVVFMTNPDAQFCHCIPTGPSVAEAAFVRDNIFRPLGFTPKPEAYPPLWVVGANLHSRHLKSFLFAYDPFCASRSIEISGYDGESRDGREIAQELISMLNDFPDARHVRLAVLIDKRDFIENLLDAGFELTAYLPAWYRERSARYDCVLMARGHFPDEPKEYGLRDLIEFFRRGLGSR
jgi:GNAT superfamily N-acetyltransferase